MNMAAEISGGAQTTGSEGAGAIASETMGPAGLYGSGTADASSSTGEADSGSSWTSFLEALGVIGQKSAGVGPNEATTVPPLPIGAQVSKGIPEGPAIPAKCAPESWLRNKQDPR